MDLIARRPVIIRCSSFRPLRSAEPSAAPQKEIVMLMRPRRLPSKALIYAAALASVMLAGNPARAQWLTGTGAATGTTNDSAHSYTTTANWTGGTINDSFAGFTFSGATQLYLSAG